MSKDSENENKRLAREWMASPHWGGVRVGCVDTDGRVCISTGSDSEGCQFAEWSDGHVEWQGDSRPLDLTHPGTRAFLLEDVRRAWASEGAVNWQSGPEWHYVVRPGYQFFNPGALYGKGKTEQAALMAALRAAPDKTK